ATTRGGNSRAFATVCRTPQSAVAAAEPARPATTPRRSGIEADSCASLTWPPIIRPAARKVTIETGGGRRNVLAIVKRSASFAVLAAVLAACGPGHHSAEGRAPAVG